MKKLIVLFVALALVLSVTACSASSEEGSSETNDGLSHNSDNSGSEVKEISFMYWGGPVEKEAIEKIGENFNKDYEGDIKVDVQHVPNDNYGTKLNTMLASNQAPDVAYVGSSTAVTHAKEGDLVFIEDILGDDKSFLDNVLEEAMWKVDGKVAFFSTAAESLMISYNRDIFDEQDVEYPPSKIEDALTWDEFVDICKSVTIDSNGNNANHADFDSDNIATYGVSISHYLNSWYPLLASLGGDIFNDDYTNTTINSPEMVDLMERLYDLVYVHHCTPSPTVSETLSSEALQTGQIAMVFDGNWSLLDYYEGGDNIGLTMFPDLGNGPYTLSAPGVTVIFDQTENPEAAWEFYKYSLDAKKGATELYQNGLWQPIYKNYYTDEEEIAFWVDNDAHPEEYRSVIVDNIFTNALRLPQSYINDWGELSNVIDPTIESILGNEKQPKEALDEGQETIEANELFKGRFDE